MEVIVKLAEDAIITMRGKAGRKIVIRDCRRYDLPQGTLINDVITDEDTFRQVLKQIKSRYGIYAGRIRLVFGSNQIPAKVIVVPALRRRQMYELVEKELEHYNVEEKERVYDYSLIRKNKDTGMETILCAAVERGKMEIYRKLFGECKMRVVSADIALNALLHLVEALPELTSKTLMLAVLDGRNMMTTLYIDGVYRHTGRSRFLHERGSLELMREAVHDIGQMAGFARSLEGGAAVPVVYFGGIGSDEREILFDGLKRDLGIEGRMLMMTERFLPCEGVDYSLSDYVYATGNLLGR